MILDYRVQNISMLLAMMVMMEAAAEVTLAACCVCRSLMLPGHHSWRRLRL